MSLVQQYLRGQVLGSSTKSVGPSFNHLGKTEISQLEVPVFSDQQVLRLQVTENDVSIVKVLKYQDYLGCIET